MLIVICKVTTKKIKNIQKRKEGNRSVTLKTENEENILKAAKKNSQTHFLKGKTIRMVGDFSLETTAVRWKGCNIFQGLKIKKKLLTLNPLPNENIFQE